jgi:methyl-accepting chemotaxis protein
MKIWNERSLGQKLTIALLAFGLIPALIIASQNLGVAKSMGKAGTAKLESQATTVISRVERNLFERYGDVQAFGLNTEVYNRDYWYQKNGPISQLFNKYLSVYTPIYYLTVMVDTNGKTIATSTTDDLGNKVDTSVFFKKNYGGDTWLQNLKAGKFSTWKTSLLTLISRAYSVGTGWSFATPLQLRTRMAK